MQKRPITNDTGELSELQEGESLLVDSLQLRTDANITPDSAGQIVWNDFTETPSFVSNGVAVNLSVELLAQCRNNTGSVIPKGTAVCIVGASAQRISIAPSDRTQPGSACRTIGLTLEEIANNSFGKVSTFGLVSGLNTSAFNEGDELFVGDTPGSLTATEPDAPARRLIVGYVVTSNPNVGTIFVTIRRGLRMNELDDVQQVAAYQDGDVFAFNAANGRFENTSAGSGTVTSVDLTAGTGISVSGGPITTSGSITVNNTAPDQVVSLTGTGATTVSGTYPNFTIDSTDTNYTAGNGISLVGTTFAVAGGDGLTQEASGLALGTPSTLNTSTTNAITATSHTHAVTFPVTSVAGKTGAVTLAKADVGLSNVDNTSDLNKPISTATQAALDDKVDKVAGKQLSTEDYTTNEKNKLAGIEAGAQVNVGTNLGITAGTTAGPIVTSSTGNNATLPTASATASGVITTGNQTFAGVKTFNSTITGSISGNSATATALQNARLINGVSFNGTANITLPTVNTTGDQIVEGLKTFRQATGTRFEQAAGQDAVLLQGRAAGTGSFQVTIIPGTLSANRTLTLANANTVLVGGTMVATDRTINTGDGLNGGGNLSANRTFSVDSTVVRNTSSQTINGDLSLNSTGFVQVPVGTTAQRPSPQTGMIRFNTSRGCFEGYNGSAWINMTPINFDDVGSST